VLPQEELTSLRSRFARFAEEAQGRSPLYAHLSRAIAEDGSLASVLDAASRAQRRPNLLFAAVHDLILAGAAHRLAVYYPSVGGCRVPDEAALPAFRAFVEEFRDEVVERVRTRATQTNEPGRSAALRPALAQLAGRSSRPVALVELGGSAGLLLHLDRYRYRYGDRECGPDASPVLVAPGMRGATPTGRDLPHIVERINIDLNPLSPSAPDQARWLRACVWPEDVQRLSRLDAALAIAREHDDVEDVAGDIVVELAPTVRRIEPDKLVCVMHSAAVAYLDEPARSSLERDLAELGEERDIARIAFEGPFVEPFAAMERSLPVPARDEERFLLGLTTWIDSGRADTLLARVQPHGAWLDWLDTPPSR
jgi:hypothetical protein